MQQLSNHYLPIDIAYYVNLNPINNIIHPTEKFVLQYIDNLYHVILENKNNLLEKDIQFEKLDHIYILNKQLNTFSLEIFEDMSSILKFINKAFIFILLKGDEQYLPKLKSLKNTLTNNELLDFVYDIFLHKNHPYFEKISFLQQIFKDMSNETIPLRKNLSSDQMRFFIKQNENFKNFYQNHTLEESIIYLKKLPFYQYIIDYKSWYKIYKLKNGL